jgi:hypothetical protein
MPAGLNIEGTFVNPNGLMRHLLRFSLESAEALYGPYIWYEYIDTSGKTYGNWSSPHPNNGQLYPAVCDFITNVLPASVKASFVLNVKDMTTGATDDYEFCVQGAYVAP